MRYRIKAAWKVLRGEWVAQPGFQFWTDQNYSTSSGASARVVWSKAR